jgi:hypothetical protein
MIGERCADLVLGKESGAQAVGLVDARRPGFGGEPAPA